ncbi:MAG: hypothetical protein LBI79_05980 [Nitrososphaerota archaeon]|nr:hypothetical protein [Nitrososphaerota archaeon]
MRERTKISQIEERGDGRRKYRIDIGAYGSIGIEAPTKEECLELFKEVTRTKRDQRIDEAIR